MLGLSGTEWDDRLLRINSDEGQTNVVCYGDDYIAVDLTTGAIALYHAASYQEQSLTARRNSQVYTIPEQHWLARFLRAEHYQDLGYENWRNSLHTQSAVYACIWGWISTRTSF